MELVGRIRMRVACCIQWWLGQDTRALFAWCSRCMSSWICTNNRGRCSTNCSCFMALQRTEFQIYSLAWRWRKVITRLINSCGRIKSWQGTEFMVRMRKNYNITSWELSSRLNELYTPIGLKSFQNEIIECDRCHESWVECCIWPWVSTWQSCWV